MKKRFLLNAALGFAALLLFNAAGGLLGPAVGLNVLNACVVGVLGVCGFALLLVLQALSR